LRDIRDKFVYAGSKSVSSSLAGAAWPVYEDYKVEQRNEDIFIYAPFRPPAPEPGRIYDRLPEDLGLKRHYAPLRDYPDLFLRFAAISLEGPLTKDELLEVVLSWSKNYGVLGIAGVDHLEAPGRRADRMGRRESLAAFSREVLDAARVLALYESATASDPPGRELTAALEAWHFPTQGQTLGEQREFALFFVADRVGAYVSGECYPVLYRQVLDDRKIVGFSQGLGFYSLLGAMYLQMMWLMTEGSEENVRRCARPGCPRIIAFDPGVPEYSMVKGARGKYRTRKDKKYCSSACKQWVYDRAKKQSPS
jgi:hypothetical protein